MPYVAVCFLWRKSGTTPAEFQHHYESTHMPLVRALAGDKFPLTHTRHYLQRHGTESAGRDPSNVGYPAVIFAGEPSVFDFDAYAELVFDDESAFQQFFAHMTSPEIAAKLGADEELFLDRARLSAAAVAQVSVTAR